MWRKGRREALDGLDDEIRDHLDRETEINIARGMSPDEARRQARLAFGNTALVQEDARAAWTWASFEQMRQDLRFGARILTTAPGLSLTAAMLIALVIGINTTIFSMVNGLVTRPAPGVEAEGLVRIALVDRPGAGFFSYPDYQDYAAQTTTLRSLSAFTNRRMTVASDRGSYAFNATAVDTNYFETIGMRVIKGRTFTVGEQSGDSSGLVAIISERAWQRHFGNADDIIGTAIAVNGQPATIVGVAPKDFRGTMLMEQSDVWLPLVAFWRLIAPQEMQRWLTDRTVQPVDLIGRLAPGKSISEAQADFTTMQARLELSHPVERRSPVSVVRYSATAGGVIPAGAPAFMAIFSIVTLLTVLIVSANVANLMLGRAAARQRETAVRQSLGASRTRISRLLFAEGLSISALAWLAACVMTFWAARTIPHLMPDSPLGNDPGLDFSPDWRVVGYAMLLAGIGTVAFTLAPAIRVWRQDPLPWLKAGEHSVAQGRSRLSDSLVILQLAFSVVLLTSAGLASRSASMMMVDLGFDPRDLLLMNVRTAGSATSREASLTLTDRILERLRSLPHVRMASYLRNPPRREATNTFSGRDRVFATVHVVDADYLAVLGLSPITGRLLTAEDRARSNAVAVINQNVADTLWPAQSAVGQRLSLGRDRQTVEVVGVVANAYVSGFNPERTETRPQYIFVTEQPMFDGWARGDPISPGEIIFQVRHEGGRFETVAAAIGPALREVDSSVPIVFVRTMSAQLEGVTLTARMIARLLTIFSLVSLLIAAIGQYAVVAFSMRRRVREFGVRIALGASARQVLSTVFGEGFALTAIGLVVGLLLSLGAGLAVRGLLFGVTPTDAPTYAGVFALLGGVALIACCLPALAATRVDPVQALRQE